MPRYSYADIPYEEFISDGTKTFVYSNRLTAIYWPIGKAAKDTEGRQAHFISQIFALREYFGLCIPVHIRWNTGEQNQMDKGCIGHAFGPGLPIASLGVAMDNEITHIILSDD